MYFQSNFGNCVKIRMKSKNVSVENMSTILSRSEIVDPAKYCLYTANSPTVQWPSTLSWAKVTKNLLGTPNEWDLQIYIFFTCHWGRVTHIGVSKLTLIGPDNGLSPSRYLNQCWNIAISNIQWNLNRNLHIFIQENAFENVVRCCQEILSHDVVSASLCEVGCWCILCIMITEPLHHGPSQLIQSLCESRLLRHFRQSSLLPAFTYIPTAACMSSASPLVTASQIVVINGLDNRLLYSQCP